MEELYRGRWDGGRSRPAGPGTCRGGRPARAAAPPPGPGSSGAWPGPTPGWRRPSRGSPTADQAWIAAEQPAHEIEYAPALRRASAEADLVLLTNTVQQTLQAAETAHRQLSAAVDSAGPVAARILWPTPLGRVLNRRHRGRDDHGCGDCLAVIDLGGGDTYRAGAGAGPDQRIAVILDLSGDDTYRGGGPDEPVQGAAVFGVALLWDGGGNDRYEAQGMAQGSGFFGAGILWDEGDGRTDAYQGPVLGPGSGILRTGPAGPTAAAETPTTCGGTARASAGPGGGIGVLGDAGGDDTYTAEVERPDHRTGVPTTRPTASTSSHAQGAAIGRRADLEEGYSWAGGPGGARRPVRGTTSGARATGPSGRGTGSARGWSTTAAANDLYEAVYYSMASGAHFCIGAIFDEGDGDDRYRLVDPAPRA